MPEHRIVELQKLEDNLRAVFNPIVARETFDYLWGLMGVALEVEEMAAIAAQLYFSWVVFTGLWAEAIEKYWVDPFTHQKYALREDAPEDIQTRLQWRELKRWDSQEQFVQYARYHLGAKSTLWYRHRLITHRIATWSVGNEAQDNEIPTDVFYEIVKAVVKAPCLTITVGDDVLSFKPVARDFEVKSPEVVSRMAGARELPPPEAPEYKREVARMVLDTWKDMDEMVAGDARISDVVGDLRESIGRANVSLSVQDVEHGDNVLLTIEYPSDSDGGVYPTERYRIVIAKENGDKVGLSKLNPMLRAWICKRLRVSSAV